MRMMTSLEQQLGSSMSRCLNIYPVPMVRNYFFPYFFSTFFGGAAK
jgi:hypothetical protein